MIEILAAVAVCVGSMVFWPELLFVLFLNAGVFKGAPVLMEFQLAHNADLTLLLECLSALSIVVGLLTGRLKRSVPRKDSLVPFLLFIAVAVCSLAYTSGPMYGFNKISRLCVITAYAFLAPAWAFGTEASIRRLLTGWVAFSLFTLSMSLGGATDSSVLFREAFGGTSGYLMVSYCAAQSALICVIFAGDRQAVWTRRLFLVCLALVCAAGALLSGSRAGPVALGMTLTALAFAVGWRVLKSGGSPRLRFRHLVIVILVTGGLGWLVFDQQAAFSGFLNRSNLLYQDSEMFEGQRMDMASLACRLILKKPLGTGIGGFTYYYLGWDASRGAFVHNIFLEVASELGWVGLGAFLALCWNALRPLFWLLKGRDRDLSIAGIALVFLFLYMLAVYQFHGDMNDARVMWAWCGALFAFQGRLRAQAVAPQFSPPDPWSVPREARAFRGKTPLADYARF